MSTGIQAASRAASTAVRTLRFLSALCGVLFLAAFVLGGRPPEFVFPLCVFSFLAGGVVLTLRVSGSVREARLDSSTLIGYASAVTCGPFAAVPSAMAAIGRVLLSPHERIGLRTAIYETARVSFQAGAAGWTFVLLGGSSHTPLSAGSIPAAFGAACVYSGLDLLLAPAPGSVCGTLLSLAGALALSAWIAALPAFSLYAPALPLAVLLHLQVRRPKREPPVTETTVEEPAKHSVIDQSSGLANRRYLEMFLQGETGRCERSGHRLTVLLVDVDHYQKLKSEDSEQAERSIAALGAAFKELLREYDVVARYQEDQFVIVLPETESTAGLETAQRLHSTLSGRLAPSRAKFSIGVATFPDYGETVDDLLSSAHHALNRAKFSGKNSVRSCHQLAKAG